MSIEQRQAFAAGRAIILVIPGPTILLGTAGLATVVWRRSN